MAIAYKKQIDADTEFALWRIEEKAEDLYKQLQLNDREKAYVEKLSHGKRHLHWLGTRVLLRKMLNTEEYIHCEVDAHGKPYLVHLPYHISLSHSFDYAAVMLSRTHPVGIDIEQIKQKVERIAHKFMRPSEMEFIQLHMMPTLRRHSRLYPWPTVGSRHSIFAGQCSSSQYLSRPQFRS